MAHEEKVKVHTTWREQGKRDMFVNRSIIILLMRRYIQSESNNHNE